MIVLMICPEYSIHSIKWLNAMVKRGHTVHSCFCKGQGDKMNMLEQSIIRHELPFKAPFGYFLNIPFLKRVVKRIKPDIIHVHRASSYASLVRKAHIRCDVLSIWGSDVYEYPYKNHFQEKNLRKNLAYAKILASTSNVMAEQSRLFIQDQTVPIHVTPFGIDVTLFAPSFTMPNEVEIKIGTVKTLSSKYGIDTMIKAFGKTIQKLENDNIMSHFSKISYEIYGKGPLKEELQALIDSLHLSNVVKLCGYVSNDRIPAVLNSFDIFLLGSREESFGVAAVEAMACELPVVATKAPGFTEVVSDNITGLLVDIDDIDKMSCALYSLIVDKQKRIRFGKAGRERAIQLYNWEDNVTQMENLYSEVVFNEK